jgi:hypothetical protein
MHIVEDFLKPWVQLLNEAPKEEQPLLEQLMANEYWHVRKLPDGSYVGLFKFLYTWAICWDLHPGGYEDRWCYPSYCDAKAALDAWDGEGEPQGWHRHPPSGRRRTPDGREEVFL